MKDWYLRQTPRDRMIVLFVGVLTICGMLYAFAWYPLQTNLARAERAIVSKQETLTYLQQGAATIKAQGSDQQAVPKSNKAPYLLIDDVIRKAGIKTPERLEPSGANGARVQFAEVSFDKLVSVIGQLEIYGLQVSTLNISRKDASGMVSVRFTMERS